MRSLTAATTNCKNAVRAEPINILAVDHGGEIGTRYYSDRVLGNGDGLSPLNAECRVIAWDAISPRAAESAERNACALVLADADGALRARFGAADCQGRAATIHQYFADLAENDLQPIFVGAVAAFAWREEEARLELELAGMAMLYRRAIGTAASHEDIPLLDPADAGRIVPLVFGQNVRRARAISCHGGVMTQLVRRCGVSDVNLFVADASLFPQGETIKLRIDDEVIAGVFSGNVFSASERGADLIENGEVTGERDANSFYDRALNGLDQAYRGYWLEVENPENRVSRHYITASSGAEHCVSYVPRASHSDGSPWTMPEGQTYKINSWARSHESGARVVLARDEGFTFILNDAPSKAVRGIETRGRTTRWQTFVEGSFTFESLLEQTGWFLIEPSLYSVNLNDTSIYGEEHPVTTVTFTRHPCEIYTGMATGALWATLDGVEDAGDGSGALLTHPGEIILALLSRWGQAPEERIDAASFAAADNEGAKYLDFGFVLTRSANAIELAADLAFQARCALAWEDGKARLSFIRDRLGAAAATLDDERIVLDSIALGATPLTKIVTEIRARLQNGEDEENLVIRDEAAVALWGRRARDISLWAHNNRARARAVAAFWLECWKRPRLTAALHTWLGSLELQRRDVVLLDHPLFAAGQKARVKDIRHIPGDGVRGQMDRIELSLELPRHAGCSSVCETACETGVETGCCTQCESSAVSCWQCETQCEDFCELACTTVAQTQCISYDSGCAACETTCESFCESSCETTCEINVECVDSISDDFNRDNETPLNTDDYYQVQISGAGYWNLNDQHAELSGQDRVAYVFPRQQLCHDDQQVTLSIGELPTWEEGNRQVVAILRQQTADAYGNAYLLGHFMDINGSGSQLIISKVVNNIHYQIAANSSVGNYTPNSMEAHVDGSSLHVEIPGDYEANATDTTWPGGRYVGFGGGMINYYYDTVIELDDFAEQEYT